MKTNYLYAILLTTFIFNACSSGITSLPVKPITNTLEGDMSDYFSIVDKEYKVEKSTEILENWKVAVQLERNDKPFAFKKEDLDDYMGSENFIKLDLVDDKGDPILDLDDFTPSSWTDLIEAKPGKVWITFTKSVSGETLKKELPENIKGFRISTSFHDFDKPKQDQDANEVSSVNDNEVSSSNEDEEITLLGEEDNEAESDDPKQWIKDYERFTDKYIALFEKQMKLTKKAQNGDMSASSNMITILSDAEELESQAEKLDKKIKANKDDLSAEDYKRFLKIQNKYTQAILKAQTTMIAN